MGRSIWTELNELRDLTERIVAGEFPTRSPLGPGQIQSKNIRARAITAPLINVSNLEAVNTQTGNLTVDGTITVSTAGKIVSGTNTDDWATFTTSPGGGQGYFHSYDATYGALVAFGDFNNVSGQYVKWDGTALTIKGVIVASSGSIAGWSITTDAIESPDGSVGMASSGHSSVAFWAGSVVPTSAEFYVTTAGDLFASSVDIQGDIWAETGRLDNLDIRGTLTIGPSGVIATAGTTGWNSGTGLYYDYNTGAPRFSLGNTSASAGLAWSTGTGLVVKGTLTATSGNFTGDVTIDHGGSLSSGQTAYDTGSGFWLESTSGVERFSIGNSAGNKMTWNGTTLAITGTITSTAGSIGGWTIDASGLRLGSGSTTRGMDTGSTAFYAGSATPGSAPFRVSTAGALVATSATLTGAVTASSLSITGTASFSGGSMTLPGGGTITSSTLDINSGTMGGLTVDGNITVGSGGKISFGSGAGDYLDNNVLHFEVGSSEESVIEAVNASNTPRAKLSAYAGAGGASHILYSWDTAQSQRYGYAFSQYNAGASGVAGINANYGLGNQAAVTATAVAAGTSTVSIQADSITLTGAVSINNGSTTAVGSSYGRMPITVPGVGVKYLELFNA